MSCVAIATAAVLSWGGTRPSIVSLLPYEGGAAKVEFINTLTWGHPTGPFTLSADGLAVEVLVVVGESTRPDWLHVSVPEGYIAVPPSLLVEDNTTGVIRIYCIDAIPLG